MKPVARNNNLLTETVGDELVVYDQERHRVHRLNKTAASIWNRCDGNTTIADMALMIPQADDSAEEVVWMSLEKLSKARLLEERIARPSDVADASRRDWMRRAAIAGGAALLLPVVSSMTAPTPAMADSGGNGNDIEIVAAGAGVALLAADRASGKGGIDGKGGGGGSKGTAADGTIPCAQRVPGSKGSGCSGAPCGPGLRCLPSLSDPSKCVCR